MPTLKAVIMSDFTKSDGTANIKIRLFHNGKLKYISTPWFIEPSKFNSGRTGGLSRSIAKLIIEYNDIITDIGPDVRDMDIETLAGRLKNSEDSKDFLKYADKRTKELIKEDRLSYATTYTAMLVHLKAYIQKDELLFKEITFDFLSKFERYLLLRKCKVNTVRIYLNNIRAIYNYAVTNEVIKEGISPFRKFKVKQERPRKRAADITDIRKLRIGPYLPAQQRSVDLFMLIFYLAGINIKDLVYLKPSNLKDGYLHYKRLKLVNKQEVDLTIRVRPIAKILIKKYRGRKYLLNFMDTDDSYEHYKNFLHETNKRLRIAGQHAGVKSYLSTYVARHSWATTAYSLGISKSDIDLSLGHNLNSMTDQYIDYSKLFARIDTVNAKVIAFLSRGL